MKIFKLILLVFVISLAIDYFGRSPLVREIAGLEKQPAPFESVKLDSVLEKYIPLDSNKEQVIDLLEKSGFKVFKDYPLPSGVTISSTLDTHCRDCDDIVSSLYTFKFFFIIPTRFAGAVIGFKNGKIIMISGSYSVRMP